MDYDKNSKEFAHLYCTETEEIKNMNEVMEEAMDVLQQFALREEGYTLCNTKDKESHLYYKKINKQSVLKIDFQIEDPSKMDKLISIIWNVNGAKLIDPHFIEGELVRIYDDNLVLLQQSYQGSYGIDGRYFYVLASKKQINDNTYIITCVSLNVKDSNNKETFVNNPYVNSANAYTLSVDPKYCKNDKSPPLKKMFINLSGYIIKKEVSGINVIYVSSVQIGISSLIPSFIVKKVKINKMLLIKSLKNNL